MSKKGGRGHLQSKKVIANLCKLAHIYELLQKKRNVISKKRQGQGRLAFFQKNIQIWGEGHP